MLRPSGVLAICIDDNELFHLGMIMDEVFGEENRLKSEISDDADMCRGVFQCIKYRALIRAHQRLRRVIPNGEAILAIGKSAPSKVRNLAEVLSVICFDQVVPPQSVSRASERPSAGLPA